MTRLADAIPATSYEAYNDLGTRPQRTIARYTALVPQHERVGVMYKGAWLGAYWQDGSVSIQPDNFESHDYGAVRRMALMLPTDWRIELRGSRLKPRLVFRGVLPRRLMNTLFLADGSVAHGPRPSRAYAELTLAELHAEADDVEDVHPLPSRRTRPLPYPVRTRLVPTRAEPLPSPRTWARPLSQAEIYRLLERPSFADLTFQQTIVPTPEGEF